MGQPIDSDDSQQRTAHGADGKFVSGGAHAHLIGKEVTLGHPGGKSIWGGKVLKSHNGLEHDATLVGQKVKVVDAHPNGKHVLVEHNGKRHIWPAKHAHEHTTHAAGSAVVYNGQPHRVIGGGTNTHTFIQHAGGGTKKLVPKSELH